MIKYLVLALILALTACGHKDSPVAPVITPEDPGVAYRAPGIRLTPVDGGSALAKYMVSAGTDIPLGSFKKSRVNLFNITNTGTVPLTGLKITSKHPAFQITPDTIPVLGVPGDTSGATPLVPIIQVWVGHGTPALAVSPEPLLWDGLDNGLELTAADLEFTWDVPADTTDSTSTASIDTVVYTMTATAVVAAVGPDRVVAGNCDLHIISPVDSLTPEDSLYHVGDTMPGGTAVFQIPGGCVHGAGIHQESPGVYSLAF